MLYNIKNYKIIHKIILLFISFFFFGIVYYFTCNDEDFGGITVIQQEIKDKYISRLTYLFEKYKQNKTNKKYIQSEMKDILEEKPIRLGDSEIEDILDEYQESSEDNNQINKINTNIEQKISKDIGNKMNSPNQVLFNRIYFSVVTGSTLGYGDYFPISNKSKIITILQLMTTYTILFY